MMFPLTHLDKIFPKRHIENQRSTFVSMNTIFLTVGTTEFDQLLQKIDQDEEFVELLNKLNCKSFICQKGRGSCYPSTLIRNCEKYGISTEIYDFKPTLIEDMKKSDLIISHCGAGSILDSISLEKKLVVVVNDSLQGNHQTELATALSQGNHCLVTTPSDLLTCLNILLDHSHDSQSMFACFPKPDFSLFPREIEKLFDD